MFCSVDTITTHETQGFGKPLAVSVNIGTVCQAAGKTEAGEGGARHSVRAGVVNQNVFVGKRTAARGLPAQPAPMSQSQCELL
jgi:hypothetical protein